jgi:luciferase-type oxidoreductase
MHGIIPTIADPKHPAGYIRKRGFLRMFGEGLTLGFMFPIESFCGDQPTMKGQERLAEEADRAGFAALWFRDVPMRDPSFGDVGQIYDVWTYAAWIAARTREIALVTGAVILPLRHPLHTAKAAASLQALSEGRFVLGVASGDRPSEFPAFGVDWQSRGQLFRDHLAYLKAALGGSFPHATSDNFGKLNGSLDLVPDKPEARDVPIMIVGQSQQGLDWIATEVDAWATYPRPPAAQASVIAAWKASTSIDQAPKPFAQSLYINLAVEPAEPPQGIHLGFSSGRDFLLEYLQALESAGCNHVVLNLKYGRRPAEDVVAELAEHILPRFPTHGVFSMGEPDKRCGSHFIHHQQKEATS